MGTVNARALSLLEITRTPDLHFQLVAAFAPMLRSPYLVVMGSEGDPLE